MTKELQQAGRRLASARKAVRDALDATQAAAVAALADGMTESEVARLAGVDRMTVRKWAGKR